MSSGLLRFILEMVSGRWRSLGQQLHEDVVEGAVPAAIPNPRVTKVAPK